MALESAEGERIVESYQVIDEYGRWREIFRSSHTAGGTEAIKGVIDENDGFEHVVAYTCFDLEKTASGLPRIRLVSHENGFYLHKTVEPVPDAGCFHVSVALEIDDRALALESLESSYSFMPCGKDSLPDFAWSPHLLPMAGDVIADHCFRSPAMIIQNNGLFGALVPDLELLEKSHGHALRTVMDMDCEAKTGPKISFGFAGWQTRGHVYFQRSHVPVPIDDKIEYGFDLILSSDLPDMPNLSDRSDKKPGFSKAARFLWRRYGRPNLKRSSVPFDKPLHEWEREAFEHIASRSYVPVDLPCASGGILKSERAKWSDEETNKDAWFSARFQSIRTAVGLFLYGLETDNDLLREKACRVVDLLLCAPQNSGVFPSIFCISVDGESGEWILDSGWAGYNGCYHSFDCSWTGYWLLRFAEIEPAYAPRILDFLVPYGDFLLKQQRTDGCIPSFYDFRTLKAREELIPFFSAETSGSALFLARLYRSVHKEKYLRGARLAIDYIEHEIIPENRWQDYETFLSCSRKPFSFYNSRTAQHPQSTLCMLQAAHAFLELYIATLENRYIEQGKNLLDYLSLYQQVWSPPFFSKNLFGGFGVQNTDAQWSDPRTCYAADLFFSYYESTGYREYLERGIAALHACFQVFPSESWGHYGNDEPCGTAGVHWGLGSAATSFASTRNRFGDVFLDLDSRFAFSLNSCWLENFKTDSFFTSFDLKSRFAWKTPAILKFTGLKHGVYSLMVNGHSLGAIPSSELKEGIRVAVQKKD